MSGLALTCDGMLAVMRRQWYVFITYRTFFLSTTLSLLFSVVLFHYISQLVRIDAFPSAENYFAFVIVGMAIMQVLLSTLGVAATVREELQVGTFERLVVSPFGPVAGVTAMVVFPFLQSLLTAFIMIAIGGLLYGLPIDWATAPYAVPIALVGALAFTGLGLLFTAIVLIFKQAIGGTNFIIALITLVAGVYFPVALLPEWIQWTSDVQPFTPAIELMRHVLVGTPIEHSAWATMAKLVGFAVILMPLSILALRGAVRWSQRRGTIIEY